MQIPQIRGSIPNQRVNKNGRGNPPISPINIILTILNFSTMFIKPVKDERQRNKRTYSYHISEYSIEGIKAIAKDASVSQSQVIETAITREIQRYQRHSPELKF